ncbi:cytochrome P450 CYP749A22-like [Cornus florida]|uniref:cytochrome P450 CYP749A22-like n=1 Tax=Cornus florida TaxID=4283 RepID=UPI00289642BA|nr:cytochrome P450 CYP749A22-like [Cornus florida]
MITILSSCLCLYLLFTLTRFLHKVWWKPIRIQHFLASQGIKGPSYKFLHGNTKEILKMRMDSTRNPIDLSHHGYIFPIIQPHTYSWIKIYGKNFLNWYGAIPQLLISELELVKEILSNKDGAYRKVKVEGYVKKLVGDGLVTSDGEKWLKQRKLANHAFHAEGLKGMIPEMIASVEVMLAKWRHHESEEIEVYNEFKVLTSEIISRTAFGSSYVEGKIIFEMLSKLGVIFSRNNFKIRFPGIGKIFKSQDDIEAEKIDQTIRDSAVALIKKREEKVKSGESESYGSDFLGSLVKVHHDVDKSRRITVDDIIDECKTFYIAGQEPTTSLLSWSILLLATHKEWQERARNEVLELFGKENPFPEGIARLKTMNLIINETLRLYGPSTNISRRVEREVRLGKLILPADIEVHIPPVALHSNPEIWGQDAHLFKPERFAEGVVKATNDNIMAFMPFGYGPRTCVGLNFATTEVKIALSMILQRYKFTLSPNYVHSPIQILILQPRTGLQVMFHKL